MGLQSVVHGMCFRSACQLPGGLAKQHGNNKAYIVSTVVYIIGEKLSKPDILVAKHVQDINIVLNNCSPGTPLYSKMHIRTVTLTMSRLL